MNASKAAEYVSVKLATFHVLKSGGKSGFSTNETVSYDKHITVKLFKVELNINNLTLNYINGRHL